MAHVEGGRPGLLAPGQPQKVRSHGEGAEHAVEKPEHEDDPGGLHPLDPVQRQERRRQRVGHYPGDWGHEVHRGSVCVAQQTRYG